MVETASFQSGKGEDPLHEGLAQTHREGRRIGRQAIEIVARHGWLQVCDDGERVYASEADLPPRTSTRARRCFR
jgi:hypothetical protein